MVPGSFQDFPRNPQEPPKTAQDGSKKSPRCPKFHPRCPQDLPKTSRRPPKWLQERSRCSKLPHELPKTLPRPPENLQNASKTAREAPKLPLQPPKTLPSYSVTQIFEILGRFGGGFPIFELGLFAENMKSSLNPSSNPKFQTQYVNLTMSIRCPPWMTAASP